MDAVPLLAGLDPSTSNEPLLKTAQHWLTTGALRRGFDSEQFRLVLQSWCLFTKIDFGVMARWLETALDLPDMQVTQEVLPALSSWRYLYKAQR